jgi:hypothetical protein
VEPHTLCNNLDMFQASAPDLISTLNPRHQQPQNLKALLERLCYVMSALAPTQQAPRGPLPHNNSSTVDLRVRRHA